MAKESPAGAGNGGYTVPVVQEQLQVEKRTVDTGRGVRVHKTISEHPHNIDETLMHDSVQVTRVPVDKIVSLSEAPAPRQEGDTLIVPILEEVLVTEKRLRIKEEIHITRTQRHSVIPTLSFCVPKTCRLNVSATVLTPQ